MQYNYLENEVLDVKDYIKDNHYSLKSDRDCLAEELSETLMLDDTVTGNASGSYTFNTLQAEQNLVGNWNLLQEAVEELAPDINILEKGPEWCDVLVRVYLLDQAIDQTLDDLLIK